ncbi:mitochondrial ribosomal protein subunit L2 [Coprinopsis marcescibilis]|uniref:Large ribosomal subunit protein uL2m n=1 Tax=Coprinopsis marcescibilis TaxID=230819 RepID=A0A5C3KMR0_COPMA|nr:mitochondrial ribosomal protein subunit L2 [Coprinopsis marcescibilis]
MLSALRRGSSGLLKSSINSLSRSSGSGIQTSQHLLTSSTPSQVQPLAGITTTRRNYATEIWKNQKVSTEFEAALSRTENIFKTYKAITPSRRHLRRPLNLHVYKGRPVRDLTIPKRKKGGRNSDGRITVRHRGGGHKQRIRTVDFMRTEGGVHDVVRIEYDPGRSAHIALLSNRDPAAQGTKKWSYIIATEGLRAGDQVQSFRNGIPEGFIPGFEVPTEDNLEGGDIAGEAGSAGESASQSLALGILRSMTLKPGNVLPLRLVPPGTVINNICLKPDGPAILVRSAGTFGQVVSHEDAGRYVHIRLQSGEVRKVLRDCCATIGKISNPLWKNRSLGKAGRRRWLGWRPSVRGMAMNACDHPHGGGRGKSKSDKHPVSIWGWGTKGTRTRKPGPKGPKNSNKMVVRERPRGKEKRTS